MVSPTSCILSPTSYLLQTRKHWRTIKRKSQVTQAQLQAKVTLAPWKPVSCLQIHRGCYDVRARTRYREERQEHILGRWGQIHHFINSDFYKFDGRRVRSIEGSSTRRVFLD